jgi:MFS family permease
MLIGFVVVVGLKVDSNWSWRFPCILAILGPIIVLSILVTAPESPRFLVKAGKEQQALEMLAKYHANDDENDELVQWELNEIREALKEEEANHKTSYVRSKPCFFIAISSNLLATTARLLENKRQSEAPLGFIVHCSWCQLGW